MGMPSLGSVILPAVWMVAGLAAAAEPSPIPYSARVWGTEDGLPQNRVQTISQTPDGYLWIGTSGGLVRFDGVRFTNFDRSNTPALLDDSILALYPARDGGMWVGTEGGGVVRMNGRSFSTFGPDQGLTNGFVRALREDRSGRLWIGTDRGFFVLEKGKIQRLDGKGDIPILSGRGIAEEANGRVVVATSLGLFVATPDHLARLGSRTSDLSGVAAGPDGSLWLATQSGLISFPAEKPYPAGVHWKAPARTPLFDSEGNIWLGTTGQGLFRMGKSGERRFRAPDPLPHDTVWCVFEDKEGNIWVGTQNGLLRLSATAVKTITRANGLDEDDVVSVYQDPGGKIWIGTPAGGLHTLAGDRANSYHPPTAAGDFRPRNLYVDSLGTQWFGSSGQGLLQIEHGVARHFRMSDGLRSNNVRQVLRDRSGMAWIATGSGLSRWDGRSIRTFYLEDGLAYGGVRSLAEDANGDLLVGTDGGMNRVRDSVFVKDPVLAQLKTDRIWAILPDKDGLWLGTRGSGVIRIRKGRVSRLTTKQGLPGNSIYQILDGGDGSLWMSGSAGIFSVSRAELDAAAAGRVGSVASSPWGLDEGVLSTQMNGGMHGAGFRSADGDYWFPGVKGAVRISPSLRRPIHPRPVLIESVVAADNPIPVTGEIVIRPGRGKLQIDFTSPNLSSPDRVSFQYRLEGFEETWNPASRARTAYYTNIPPAKYRFHVIARSGTTPGDVTEAILPLVWLPHFYETGWFYACMAALAGLMLFGALRFYARVTRARFSLVLEERTRLAREMHDTVIQGCVGVSSLLEAARSLPPSASGHTHELLERAAEQVRVTVNEAREAVWDLRNSDPSAERNPAALFATLENFARQAESSSGIPVRAEVAGSAVLLGERAGRNLLLVAREAIRNAVAHARPTVVTARLTYSADEVCLEVLDDGSGFVPSSIPEDGHYGIMGMRERMKQSGGTLELMSTPGNGTRVVARLSHLDRRS